MRQRRIQDRLSPFWQRGLSPGLVRGSILITALVAGEHRIRAGSVPVSHSSAQAMSRRTA